MRHKLGLAAALAFALVGTALLALAPGDPEYLLKTKVETRFFRIKSDLSPKKVALLGRLYDDLTIAIAEDLLDVEPVLGSKIDLLIVGDEARFAALVKNDTPFSSFEGGRLIMNFQTGIGGGSHVLAYALVARLVPQSPAWTGKMIATFVEKFQASYDGGPRPVFTFGLDSQWRHDDALQTIDDIAATSPFPPSSQPIMRTLGLYLQDQGELVPLLQSVAREPATDHLGALVLRLGGLDALTASWKSWVQERSLQPLAAACVAGDPAWTRELPQYACKDD